MAEDVYDSLSLSFTSGHFQGCFWVLHTSFVGRERLGILYLLLLLLCNATLRLSLEQYSLGERNFGDRKGIIINIFFPLRRSVPSVTSVHAGRWKG